MDIMELLRILGIGGQQPTHDSSGIQMPVPGQVPYGQPQQQGGLMGHYGNVMGGFQPQQQQPQPDQLEMIMRMIGRR